MPSLTPLITTDTGATARTKINASFTKVDAAETLTADHEIRLDALNAPAGASGALATTNASALYAVGQVDAFGPIVVGHTADINGVRRRVQFTRPIVWERDKLMFPAFRTFGDDDLWTQHNPPAGAAYWVYPLFGFGSGPQQWYFKPGNVPSITEVVGFGPANVAGSIVLASGFDGYISSQFPMAGLGGLGQRANQCTFTKDARDATRLFGTTLTRKSSVLADAYFTSKGFTWSVADAQGQFPFYGEELAEAKFGQRMFVRVVVKTSLANTFGSPNIKVFDVINQPVTDLNLLLEEKLSTTLAVYSLSFELPFGQYDASWFWVGVEGLGGSGTIVQLQGLQYHCGPEPAWWIARDDLLATAAPARDPLATATTPLYGETLFMTSGRPMPFYPGNIMRSRSDGDEYVTTFWSLKSSAASYPHTLQSAGDTMVIDPDKCGTTGKFEFRRRGGGSSQKNRRSTVNVDIKVAPTGLTGTVNVLYLGDSISNRGALFNMRAKAQALGLTVNMIGTMSQGGALGEAREGWSFSDFTNQRDRPLIYPLAAGQEATYQAYADDGTGTTTQKLSYNPFLKTPTANDIATKSAFIFSDLIFDPGFYISRFGLTTPNVVLINLGMNDIAFAVAEGASMQSWVQTGLIVMYNQFRDAFPAARIGFILNTQPRSHEGDFYWPNRSEFIIEETIKYINPIVDANLYILSAHAHMSAEVGWPASTTSTSNLSVQARAISDGVHPSVTETVAQHQIAEVTSSFVACAAAGVI